MCVSRMTAGCQGGCFSGNRKMGGASSTRGADGISGEIAKDRDALQHTEEDEQNMGA